MPRIFYFCPELPFRSAGVRTLHRHVAHLNKNGVPAMMLYLKEGYRAPDVEAVPTGCLLTPNVMAAGDILAMPEGDPGLMNQLKNVPVRKIVVCQNWSYAFMPLPVGTNWRDFNIERVLAYPESSGAFLQWAMKLPVHVFDWGVREDLFYDRPDEKIPQIAFITRKQHNLPTFLQTLACRNRAFVEKIKWVGMDALGESEYARIIRQSAAFINLSVREGLYAPYLESMRSGTIVVGYNAVGAREALIGGGPLQNCITAENEDYMTLGMRMEPLLEDLLRGNVSRWRPVIQNALNFSAAYTMEREEKTIVRIWREILGR